MRVLVTGANGFVGRALCLHLAAQGHKLTGMVRRPNTTTKLPGEALVVDLETDFDLSGRLAGVDCIVHLAARVHRVVDNAPDPMAAFRLTNCKATLRLALQALQAGVRRFVFISTIGVNGDQTMDAAFDESSPPTPRTAYAQSKWEAEQGLQALFTGSNAELVVIRPPLVYGAAAPGNFSTLLGLVARGVPLPFLAVRNRRSLIALDNLIGVVSASVVRPAAAGHVLAVADGIDVSTPDIIRHIAAGTDHGARLFWCPPELLKLAASLLRRPAMYRQLCGSLTIDSRRTAEILGWRPVTTPAAALEQAGRDYVAQQRVP